MLVQVYRMEAVSRKCVYNWFKRLRNRKGMTENEPCLGQPSTNRTPDMIECDKCLHEIDDWLYELWRRSWALARTRCAPSSVKI